MNIVVLTATATAKLRVGIAKLIGMENEVVVSVPPCKCNIMYAFTQFKTIGDTFLPVVEWLHRERTVSLGNNLLSVV